MYLGEGETDRRGYIQSLVDQYHGVSNANSWDKLNAILYPVFSGKPNDEQRELRHEFQVLMMQWNYDHQGRESINPYASLFHYLDALG